METYYTEKELGSLGLKSFGKNVKISRNAILYSPQEIEIGDNVRIDDFCILSGKISFGNFIHLSQFVSLYGGEKGIFFKNFIAVASRTMIYAVSDDYVNASLETPMVPMHYKKMVEGEVLIDDHVIFGANTIVLPNVNIAKGSSFGAMSLVTKNTDEYSVYVGTPCKKIKNRNKEVELLEEKFMKEIGETDVDQ